MKKPTSQVAPSQSRFDTRQEKDTRHPENYKLEDLKERLPSYLARYHGEAIHRQTDHSLTLHCPFHEDRTPSFVADDKKGTWLFKCFSCERSGSIIDLHAEKEGMEARSFEAIQATAQALGLQLTGSSPFTPQERNEWARQKRESERKARELKKRRGEQETLTGHQRETLHQKLKPYLSKDWRADLFYSSPISAETPFDRTLSFLEILFPPEAVLWMGEPWDTGQAKHRENFRTCRDWLQCDEFAPRIAGGHFRPDSFSRSQESVSARPFIVVESDDLIGRKPASDDEKRKNRALSYALAGYCQHELGLYLRAVIDTGNKSFHLWFDRPAEAALSAVRALAPGLRIDTGLLDSCASAPLRMPGCVHEKTNVPAALLYLDTAQS